MSTFLTKLQPHSQQRPWPDDREVQPGQCMQEEFGKGRRYTYKGGYFETRAQVKTGAAKWTGCPDLFGDGPAAAVYP